MTRELQSSQSINVSHHTYPTGSLGNEEFYTFISNTSFAVFHAAVLLLTHTLPSQMSLFIKYYQQNTLNYSETMMSRNLQDYMILEQQL